MLDAKNNDHAPLTLLQTQLTAMELLYSETRAAIIGEFDKQTHPWLFRASRYHWLGSDNCGAYLANRPKGGYIEPGDLTAKRTDSIAEHKSTLKDLGENEKLSSFAQYLHEGLLADGYESVSAPTALIDGNSTTGILVLKDRDTYFGDDYYINDYHWFVPVIDDNGELQIAQKAPSRNPTVLSSRKDESVITRLFEAAQRNGYSTFGGYYRITLNPRSSRFINYDL